MSSSDPIHAARAFLAAERRLHAATRSGLGPTARDRLWPVLKEARRVVEAAAQELEDQAQAEAARDQPGLFE